MSTDTAHLQGSDGQAQCPDPSCHTLRLGPGTLWAHAHFPFCSSQTSVSPNTSCPARSDSGLEADAARVQETETKPRGRAQHPFLQAGSRAAAPTPAKGAKKDPDSYVQRQRHPDGRRHRQRPTDARTPGTRRGARVPPSPSARGAAEEDPRAAHLTCPLRLRLTRASLPGGAGGLQ